MIRACAPDAPASFAPLPRSFYARPVHEVARDLLGTIVVRTVADRHGAPSRLAGRIVEVEAYDGPRDLACHAAKGRTPRTAVVVCEAGHARGVGGGGGRQAGGRGGGGVGVVVGSVPERGRGRGKNSRRIWAAAPARPPPRSSRGWLSPRRARLSSDVPPTFGSRAPNTS